MLQEQVKMTGQVSIRILDKDGNVKDERTFKNLVVSAGKTFIASRMVGTSANIMSHMAIGSDNTAADAADTALGSELGRVAIDSGTSSGAVATFVATFPAGTGTGAVVEAGLFNASSSGTMLCRTVFSVVNKGADDAMTITWQVTVS